MADSSGLTPVTRNPEYLTTVQRSKLAPAHTTAYCSPGLVSPGQCAFGRWLHAGQDLTGPQPERQRRKEGIRVEETAWAKHRGADTRPSSSRDELGMGKAEEVVGAVGTALSTRLQNLHSNLEGGTGS